jgi:microcystin-dependent protein
MTGGWPSTQWSTPDEVAAKLCVCDRLTADGPDCHFKTPAPRRSHRAVRAGLVSGLALAILFAQPAAATSPMGPEERIPRQIPYRGILDSNGSPVLSDSLPMTFEIFDAEQNGKRLWDDSMNVAVQDGQFTVALGDKSQKPIPASVFEQPNLYLQVTVNGQLLAGRQRLLSVPYAQSARSALTAGGKDIASALVPPGTIVAYGGSTPPAGWLRCDGRTLSRSDSAYQGLFAAIGYLWGGSGDAFQLPDLQGRFLRGVGGNSAPLGQAQGDATAVRGLTMDTRGNHNHNPNNSTDTAGFRFLKQDGYWTLAVWDERYAYECTSDSGTGGHEKCAEPNLVNSYLVPLAGDHVHSLSGDIETRPVNASVGWFIKL